MQAKYKIGLMRTIIRFSLLCGALAAPNDADSLWGGGLIEKVLDVDVFVVGGGAAGNSAAIAAARGGASTVLVEGRSVLERAFDQELGIRRVQRHSTRQCIHRPRLHGHGGSMRRGGASTLLHLTLLRLTALRCRAAVPRLSFLDFAALGAVRWSLDSSSLTLLHSTFLHFIRFSWRDLT